MEKLRFKRCKHLAAFFLTAIFMAFSLGSYAQQRTISGKVSDQAGMPIPGVTVVVQGTTVGTVTNLDGDYQLAVPVDASILVFSYIGMVSQNIEIANRTTINVTLQADVIGVGEVVVVGYGTRMREELTGAISTVSQEQMTISTEPSVMSRIQGQVSGVTITSANRPGGDATIRIRGLGTINDNNPLYIIDGVPAGPGNNISPNDIESISILKDASSAAIYGTRGANGVVIITTKRGKANQKPSFTFTARTGITQGINQYDLLNTAEYGEAMWLQARNLGLTPGVNYSHPQYGSGANPVIPDYILPAGAKEGSPGVNPALYNYPSYVIFKANKQGTNWYDEIYQNGLVQDYDLSISGGGENHTFAMSGNYLSEEGILIHTKFERFSFRLNSEAKLNNWFKAGESLQVAYIDEYGNLGDNDEGTVISQAYRSQPIIPVYDIQGNFAGSKAPAMGNSANPVAQLYRAKDNNGKYLRIIGNVFAEVYPTKGLTLRSLLGYNVGQWNGKYLSLANYEFSEPQLVDGVSVNSNYSIQWNWTNTANYSTTFADVHKLNVILGTEAIENKYQWMEAARRQYFSNDPKYMQLSAGELNQTNAGSGSEWAVFSVFGRVNYDVMGKYYLEATARRDGSSRFSGDNRYATFPAVSAAWSVSEENFMSNTRSWLDALKLRLGWGMSGNDRIGEYNMFSTFSTNNYMAAYPITGSNTSAVAGFQPSTKGNENVTWETTKTLNGGVDVTVFDRKLNFSVDVWQRYTSDMLYRLSVPEVMGLATPPFINIGEMKNTGFDFEIGYNNTAFNNQLRYSLNATVSRYVNEIMKLSDKVEEEIITGNLRQVNYSRAAVGTSFPEFYGYIVDGIFQTAAEAAAHPAFGNYNAAGHFKYRDVNGDGVISPADMTYIGSPHPDFTGGLNVDLGYGNFDLNMFFYGSYGNDMINFVNRWIDFGMFNGGLSKRALYESWGSPYLASNADATLPKLDGADGSQQPSTHFVEDASFLRMKTLRLGYTVPQSVLDRAQIKSLRLYGQVTNLFTLTSYSGLDPELNQGGTMMGLDRGAWPTPRQYMFGLVLGL